MRRKINWGRRRWRRKGMRWWRRIQRKPSKGKAYNVWSRIKDTDVINFSPWYTRPLRRRFVVAALAFLGFTNIYMLR